MRRTCGVTGSRLKDSLTSIPPNVRLFTGSEQSVPTTTTKMVREDGRLRVVSVPDTVSDITARMMQALQYEAGKVLVVDYSLEVTPDQYPFATILRSPAAEDLLKTINRTRSDVTLGIVGWQSVGELGDLEEHFTAACERGIDIYLTWVLPEDVDMWVCKNPVEIISADYEDEWFEACDRMMVELDQAYPGRHYFYSDSGVMRVILLTDDKSFLEKLLPDGVWERSLLSEQGGWDVVPGDGWA